MKALRMAAMTLMTLLVLLLSAGGANAQQVCAARDSTVNQLEGRFDEHVVGRGLAESGKSMIELFVGENGSWTVVVTDTRGRSCLVASGVSWMQTPLLVGDPV